MRVVATHQLRNVALSFVQLRIGSHMCHLLTLSHVYLLRCMRRKHLIFQNLLSYVRSHLLPHLAINLLCLMVNFD